jgi:hypothetical protein
MKTKTYQFKNGKETLAVKVEPFGNWFELPAHARWLIEWEDQDEEVDVLEENEDELRILFEFDDDTRFFINGKEVNENGEVLQE